MDLLFKLNGNDPDKQTLAYTNFMNHYPTIHKSMNWATIKPFVRTATRKYILKFVDQSSYDALASKFQNNASLDASETEWLEKLQDAIAYYTIYEAMPHVNVTLSDNGAQQTLSENNSSVPTNQWSFKVMRWETLKNADELIDHCLEWMENEVKSGNTLFDDYKSSDEYKKGRSSLFKTTAELQSFIDIRNSRRTFLSLVPFLEKAAKKHIIPLICSDLYEEVVNEYKNNSLSAKNEAILSQIQAVIAEYGTLMALPHLSIVMEDSGFKVISQSDGMSHKNNLSSTQHMEAIQQLKYQLESDGKSAKADLIQFLYDNIDTYPLFKESSCFVDMDEEDDLATCLGPGGVML